MVNSNMKYNGMGYLPCNGYVPCQVILVISVILMVVMLMTVLKDLQYAKKLIKWNQMNLFQPEHLSKKHKDERMANAMPCHDYKVESCLILHIWTLSSLFLMLLRISHIQISTSVSYLLQSDFGISRKVKKWPCSLFKHNEFLSDSSPIIGYPCQ